MEASSSSAAARQHPDSSHHDSSHHDFSHHDSSFHQRDSPATGSRSTLSALSLQHGKAVAATFFPGAAQGATTVLLGHPLDTAKTRMQASGPNAQRSALVTMSRMVRCEGPRSLFRGCTPPLVMEGAKRSLQFALWDCFRNAHNRQQQEKKEKNQQQQEKNQQHQPQQRKNQPQQQKNQLEEEEEKRHHHRPCSQPSSSAASSSSSFSENFANPSSTLSLHSLAVWWDSLLSAVGANPFLSGAVAGGIGTTIGCPMHVVKIQTQYQTREGTRNAWTCTTAILRRDGLGGLYRGYKYNLLKDVAFAGTYLGLYGCLRARWSTDAKRGEKKETNDEKISKNNENNENNNKNNNENNNKKNNKNNNKKRGSEEGWWRVLDTSAFFAGAAASVLTWTALYPLDTAKTLAQAGQQHRLTRQLLRQPRRLYRGLAASLLKAGPVSGVSMCVYECCKEAVEAW